MTQSQENEFGDKNNLETGPKWAQLFFLGCNNHQFLLDIIAVYHNIQNRRNLMIRSREKSRKPQDIFFENRAYILKANLM